MRKLLYNTIRQALLGIIDENNQSVIRHVDLWNQQTVLPEQEQPFDTPAVFIEFHQIQWMPLSQALREASVQVALHVVTDSRSGAWSDAIEVFALLDTVNMQLHCLSAASSDGSGNNAVINGINNGTVEQHDTSQCPPCEQCPLLEAKNQVIEAQQGTIEAQRIAIDSLRR